MSLIRRPARTGVIAALALGMTVMAGSLAATDTAVASVQPAATGYVTLSGSTLDTHAAVTGSYTSARMSVEVALAPRDESGLDRTLSALYAKGGKSYHHWLARGQFDQRYAPSAATRAAVGRYLSGYGLSVQRSASPFMVRAVGSSQQVSAAFGTTLSTYHQAGGARFFANSAPVRLPAALAPEALGVIGLSDTFSSRPAGAELVPSRAPARKTAKPDLSVPACETPYPTASQLEAFVSNGTLFPFGYGAGPGCSGLTPTQVNSIYGAPNVGAKGKGSGVTVALFEQTGFDPSDPATWAQQFYGTSYTFDLQTVLVDGGPLNPDCPAGDTCPPLGYAPDFEADLDIERVLAVAPDVAKIIVYNGPDDTDGQTYLDEFTKIASDDAASVVSSSWANGESELPTAFFQAENVIFEQMAAQGQSMLASAGDDGPLGDAPYGVNTPALIDPASQPWVTGVGGTSFEGYNPNANPSPGHVAGAESVWNADNLCQDSTTVVDGETGDFWCNAPTELAGAGNAGGGGSSAYWGRPSYQTGTGVTNPYTTYGNGSTQCSLAADGTPCREIPDVSADADTYTGYSTYCAGTADTNSTCAAIESEEGTKGWFSVAGTSSSSPLWGGIAADMDSYTGGRVGFLNPLLYQLFNTDPGKYFNDITGAGQTITTNGLFPATPGYDEATGIGTPKMAALITASP